MFDSRPQSSGSLVGLVRNCASPTWPAFSALYRAGPLIRLARHGGGRLPVASRWQPDWSGPGVGPRRACRAVSQRATGRHPADTRLAGGATDVSVAAAGTVSYGGGV